MSRSAKKILVDVLKLMESFKYTQNEDRPSNSVFVAELNEDGFFILLNEIEHFIEDTKNTTPLSLIDIICAKELAPMPLAIDMTNRGLAHYTGNQHNEDWAWNKDKLQELSMGELEDIYRSICTSSRWQF